MASPFDILRKPVSVFTKGEKRNVMSWKGTKLVPEAGFPAGSVGVVSMPDLGYDESKRRLYCRTRDVAVGDGSSFVSDVELMEVL